MTPKQIKYIRYLLISGGMIEHKDDVILEATEGRTTHITEMTYSESNSLIKWLTGEKSRDKQVGKILSMAHEMGWETPDGKVDMSRIDGWCGKYTIEKKALDKIGDKELPGVVTVFEKVYMSFLKGI